MKYILSTLAFLFLVFSLNYGMTLSERNECLKWREQFRELKGRALLQWVDIWQSWQNEQCEAVGIKVWVK